MSATANLLANDVNIVILRGTLSRDPEVRELPSGSVLHRYEVTSRPVDRPVESAPVSWIDPVKPPSVVAGDAVVVVGRVRRRFYRVGAATSSATEVVAEAVLRPSARATVQRSVERILATMDEPADDG